jgi:hypothetical protein
VRLQSLVHLAGIAAAIAPARQIVVLGSSSLLASHPDLGEPTGPLETSFDADLLIEGIDELLAEVVQESIGAGSQFQAGEGYYADVLRPAVTETFPRGWEERLVPLPGCETVRCLDPHDLAAVKMQAGRPKDITLCATLLATGRLTLELIQERLRETRMNDGLRVLASQRLNQVIEMAAKQNGRGGTTSI